MDNVAAKVIHHHYQWLRTQSAQKGVPSARGRAGTAVGGWREPYFQCQHSGFLKVLNSL